MAKKATVIQESLIGALDKLLKNKSLEDISVSELTKVAGISRMTFYRHYRNLIDILVTQVTETLSEFKQIMVYHDNAQYILEMVKFFRDHSDFVKLLLRAKQEELLRQKISDVMGDLSAALGKEILKNLTDQELHYYISYHTAGLANVIIDWISHDQPESPERLAAFLTLNVEG